MAASYSYILIAILDLGIRLRRMGNRRGIGIVDAFISVCVCVCVC